MDNRTLVDYAQAFAGWAISWLLIIGIPACAVALAKRVFPRNSAAGILGFLCGIPILGFAVLSTPAKPFNADWVTEYQYYYHHFEGTFAGLSKTAATVVGIWTLMRKAFPRAATVPSGKDAPETAGLRN